MFYKKILILLALSNICNAHLLEGLYCGNENCYDILGVSRESTKNEIAKNYRQLAKKYHPDLHKTSEAKKKAEEMFKRIATAYETLKDEESRSDYDYLLDHPEEYYAHYYRYYRRKAPKVDIKIVLCVTISLISLIQYYSSWQKYQTAINYFITVPKYRNHALEIAKEKNLLEPMEGKNNKKTQKIKKNEHFEKVIRQVIEENMDIKGAYAKPSIYDILWIQILIFPITLTKYFIWYFKWIVSFTILKKPYGEDEKLYLIRKNLKLSQVQFDGLDIEKIEEYMKLELWDYKNFLEWKAEEAENVKKSLAENARYKQYRRYIKQHGTGRMTFDDS